MSEVESFVLDHTKLNAPYVRECLYEKKGSFEIYKYDVRFCQPNKERMKPEVSHSVEHILASTIRHYIKDVIDFSPMGCLTGFYVTVIDTPYDEFILALKRACEESLVYDSVPSADIRSCGSADLHDLNGAKNYIKKFLDGYYKWKHIFIK